MESYLIITGRRGSGKDALSSYVTEKYNIPSVRFSSIIGEIGIEMGRLTKDNFEVKENLQETARYLREEHGEEYYTKRVAERVKGRTHTINGMRYPKEYDCLRELLGDNLVTIGIIGDQQIRYKRALDIGIVNSYDQFQKQEAHSAEVKINMLVDNADHKIENNGTLNEFYRKVDDLLVRLRVV